MVRIEKKDLNNFYVGELYLSCPFDNLSTRSVEEKQKLSIKEQVLVEENGAIGLFRNYTDWNKKVDYKVFLTLFYRISDGAYMCLHNSSLYTNYGDDFYNGLVSLKSLLPKMNYCAPNEISFPEARLLFEKLFYSKKKISLNSDKVKVNDLYFGTMNMYTGYSDYTQNRKYTYHNLAQTRVLYNHFCSLGCGFGVDASEKDRNGNSKGMHWYQQFKCLLLAIDSNRVYNLNNYQFYNVGTLKYEKMKTPVGECYYDQCCLLKEKNGIFINDDSITIQKALKLSRKVK